jgi:non-ribosomal peptide synthase protein (TIGR01720 family)
MFVDIESHGRHDLEEDLSRSIGWYTALYPVWLPCLASNEDIGGYVTSTAQVLAGVPNKGSGFGVLKYVMNDPDILALPEPDILFNYLGRQVMPAGSRISWSEQPVGRVRDGTAPRTHLLEITARISQGALGVQWTYSPDIHTELEIAAAASALNHDLSDLATSPMAAGGEEALRLSSALVAPVNETQNLIANIWCDVLKLEQVGINDDFFEVGGDSLIMMQIVSRLRRTFGCRVPLTAMFDQPTVEDLAAKIEAVVAGRDVF